ncbi:hypothetical protein [Petrocella sp. FN5]|uniref:hypothetical protein n=1 Tax=Petrocella sp. FN5 TaxID=3032002 RepID=UPI0023DAB5AF|nr:hypothetical protein [Petrocella sp. FN5]MDF1618559.1 hypothetical protein [Petrocella sp. FN5]
MFEMKKIVDGVEYNLNDAKLMWHVEYDDFKAMNWWSTRYYKIDDERSIHIEQMGELEMDGRHLVSESEDLVTNRWMEKMVESGRCIYGILSQKEYMKTKVYDAADDEPTAIELLVVEESSKEPIGGKIVRFEDLVKRRRRCVV